MKKLLLTLPIALAAAAWPSSLLAFEYQGINYKITDYENRTCAVGRQQQSISGDVVLPKHPVAENGTEYVLTTIGNSAFRECTSLTSIAIPEGVTEIGGSAFRGCSLLTSIAIPEGVTEIGNYTFYDCKSLSSVHLPKSLVTIDEWAFAYCSNIKSIVIPSSVQTFGNWVFSGCRIDKILYPEYLDDIEGWKPNANRYFAYPGDVTISLDADGIGYTDEGKTLYYVPSDFKGEFSIPEGVTRIAKPAFAKCDGITALNIPKGILEVDEDAFAHVNIPRVNFADWSDCCL
ncbi:MAG: leucine-rich repeat domain-containing protein [Muribaculaceae bacterium]|nr:leucine-rich repeat domain-containing protein [Muribaculaceae bacterium]